MRILPSAALLAAVAMVATAPLPRPAEAAVVLRADVEDLARTCHRAVEGTVESRVVAHRPAEGRIWTLYRVKVSHTLVGETATHVDVRVPGGQVGDLVQDVSGTARMDADDRVVLFLWKDADGKLQVLGQAQGAFIVTADPESGDAVCRNSLAGLVTVDREGRRVTAEPVQVALADLRERVLAERRRVEEEQEAARRAAEAERARRIAAARVLARRNRERLRDRPGGHSSSSSEDGDAEDPKPTPDPEKPVEKPGTGDR